MSTYHQGCSAEWHDKLLDAETDWRTHTTDREFAHILGTSRCVERAKCRSCGRTLVRRSLPIAAVVIGQRASTLPGLPEAPKPHRPWVRRD